MQHEPTDGKKAGWTVWVWMAVCCVPMIVIFLLVALGYWSFH
jgi:hypothetical protein